MENNWKNVVNLVLTFNKTNLFKVLFKMVTFSLLCAIAIYISLNVFQQFISESSTFKQSEAPIEEYPTLTFCMSGSQTEHFKYGIDFNITYNDVIIKMGKTEKVNPDNTKEVISLELISTFVSGLCYRIETKINFVMEYGLRTFILNFDEYISDAELSDLEIYITSYKNSDGILINEWMDGDELAIKIEKVSIKIVSSIFHFILKNLFDLGNV